MGDLLANISSRGRNHQVRGAFLLIWYTRCRPGEATGAEWSEIDWSEALWRIPAERMKMREPHVIPLPKQAMELLRSLQAITSSYKHLFPHRDCHNCPMTEAALRQVLYQLGWGSRYSPHATRTTGSTMLNELGCNRDWIERQLAHSDRDSSRTAYNRATYIQDRRVMMQAWADQLQQLTLAAPKAPTELDKMVTEGPQKVPPQVQSTDVIEVVPGFFAKRGCLARWEYWRRIKVVSLPQAVLLSFGVEPAADGYRDGRCWPSHRLYDRQDLAVMNLGPRGAIAGVGSAKSQSPFFLQLQSSYMFIRVELRSFVDWVVDADMPLAPGCPRSQKTLAGS